MMYTVKDRVRDEAGRPVGYELVNLEDSADVMTLTNKEMKQRLTDGSLSVDNYGLNESGRIVQVDVEAVKLHNELLSYQVSEPVWETGMRELEFDYDSGLSDILFSMSQRPLKVKKYSEVLEGGVDEASDEAPVEEWVAKCYVTEDNSTVLHKLCLLTSDTKFDLEEDDSFIYDFCKDSTNRKEFYNSLDFVTEYEDVKLEYKKYLALVCNKDRDMHSFSLLDLKPYKIKRISDITQKDILDRVKLENRNNIYLDLFVYNGIILAEDEKCVESLLNSLNLPSQWFKIREKKLSMFGNVLLVGNLFGPGFYGVHDGIQVMENSL